MRFDDDTPQAASVLNLQKRVGEAIGTSDWLTIDQARIDAFADVTLDPDPMHVDPAWCARHSPFGVTIAFGFLTVSLLTYLVRQAVGLGQATTAAGGYPLNYGFDRLRLVEPVPVGSRIRAHVTLLEYRDVRPGEARVTFGVNVEIAGRPRPALVAEWLALWVTDEGNERIRRANPPAGSPSAG